MALVGNAQAAELTGKDPSTIRKHAADGTLSFERDTKGRRKFSVSELERVYGNLTTPPASGAEGEKREKARRHPIESRASDLENVRLQERVSNLEERVADFKNQTDDLRHERDDWKSQAQQLQEQVGQSTRLLTDERERHQQKEAEEIVAIEANKVQSPRSKTPLAVVAALVVAVGASALYLYPDTVRGLLAGQGAPVVDAAMLEDMPEIEPVKATPQVNPTR